MEHKVELKVAVKQLKNSSLVSVEEMKETLNTMQREVYLNSICKHPNIVAIQGVCLGADHAPLIVMEYMGGGDLHFQLCDPTGLLKKMNSFLRGSPNGQSASQLIEVAASLEKDLRERVELFVVDVQQRLKSKKEIKSAQNEVSSQKRKEIEEKRERE